VAFVPIAVSAALILAPMGLRGQDRQAFIGATAQLFTNLTLIDGRGGAPQPNSSILVWNGRIQGAGAQSQLAIPEGTSVIDLEKAFVVPGYIDAYAAPRDSATLAAMLAAGITGVREAAMPRARFEAEGRDPLADGPLPRVYIGGPTLEGPDGEAGLVLNSAEDAVDAVARLAADDAGFISVGPGLPTAWMRDIARAARRAGVSVWMEGRTEGWVLAVRSGSDVASGLISVDPDMLSASERESLIAWSDSTPTARMIRWLEAIDPHGPDVDRAVAALLSRDASIIPLLASAEAPLRCVSTGDGCGGWPDAVRVRLLEAWPKALSLVRVLYDEGVRILVGSGSPSSVEAGAIFHHEMELLVDAGIPPIEVISMATRNGAIALGELHRRGTIERGKRADFVVLAGDPTVDIRNTGRVRMVVLDGRGWIAKSGGGFERLRVR